MPAPIRILHLITGLNTGGAEITLARLLMELQRYEFESQVVSLVPIGPVGEKIKLLGIPVISLDMPPGRPIPGGFYKLVKIIRGFRPNILQTWLYHADLLGLAAGKLTSVPVIAWNIRGSEQNIMNSPRLSRLVIKLCAMLSGVPKAVLVNSKAGLISHESLGYHPRRWALIPNGIDTALFKPAPEAGVHIRTEWGFPDDLFVIGMAARFDPQKGFQYFFQAAQTLIAKYSNLRFVCVGDGPREYSSELQAMVKNLGLEENVLWAGARTDMPAVYNAFDLLVSASTYGEGFPNVLAEAMACGIPCVATRTGDSAVLLADTGKVVTPRDAGALSDAIIDIINLPIDVRQAMGENAREQILENFSLQKMTDAYAALYRELIPYTPNGKN